MSTDAHMRQFELKLQKAIERVKLVLDAEKTPLLPAKVHHSYEDKFCLVERSSCLALASLTNGLVALGMGPEKLEQLQAWAQGSAVSLRFKSKETCEFLREVTREEESPRKQQVDMQVGGVTMGSFTSKTVTKVTEFFWKFKVTYELEAIRGVGAEEADQLPLCSRTGHVELKTSTKAFPHPESRISTEQEVNISFLIRRLEGSPPAPAFAIDRLSPKCRTPRRNGEVEEAEAFFYSFLRWAETVSRYFERLRGIHPSRSTAPGASREALFVPALPLFVKGPSGAGPQPREDSLVLLGEDGASESNLVVHASDANKLLSEESRILGEQRQNLTEVFPEDGSIFTWAESYRALILQHCHQVALQWLDVVDYVERMLRFQLVAAIGKEVKPAEFAAYMRFHYRKVFREAYQPSPCSFAVRRSGEHGPEGIISIEEEALGLDEASIKSPICALTATGSIPSMMTFPLNASTTVKFGGQVHLHAWLDHQFSGESASKLSLVSRARQFSSFMVLIGRISSSTSFDPKYAALVQNKDELEIPLELSTIPTPKEFKDAIESLSPEQKEFAKAFRAMQLESTLFAVLVVQIKPQLEQLLNLAEDSLTKEIKLTQDLMQLFIKYQIPSDLLSFTSDLLPHSTPSAADRLRIVKGQVQAMNDMIEAEKREELEQRRKEEELRRLQREEAERFRQQQEQALWEAQRVMEQRMDEVLLRGEVLEDFQCCSTSMAENQSFKQRAGSGFFGGMGKAVSGAIQSLGGSGGVKHKEMERVSAPRRRLSHDTAPAGMKGGSAFPPVPPPPSAPGGPAPAASASSAPPAPADASAPAPEPAKPAPEAAPETSAEAPAKETPKPSKPGQPEGASEPLAARDYTQVPKQLDEQFEKLDPDSALRPTIINPGSTWSKRAQPALLSAVQTSSLSSEQQKREKDSAFDLLDAITKSGALPLSHAELHIIVAATHCFDKTVTETVVQDNVNPIAKVERSSLIMASTIHQQPAACLVNESSQARVMAESPQLFLENDEKAEPSA